MNYATYLKTIDACKEAIDDAQGKTAQEVWALCERGDWMNWLIGRLSGKPGSVQRKKLCLCLSKQVRLIWDLLSPAGKNCIKILEQWARGENEITLKDVRKAADALVDAVADATADEGGGPDAVADATVAAAYTIATAYAYTAYAAAQAAAHATVYAAYAAIAAAGNQILKQCADIVRTDYPVSPAVEIIGENN